jgi:hypothetical protein
MRLFQNDAQLARALRALSEAALIDILAGDDGEPRFGLSAAITKAAARRTGRPSGRIEPIADPCDRPEHPCVLAELQTHAANVNVNGSVGFDALQRTVVPGQLE